MTILPTLSGGLKLILEEDKDWLVLMAIARDGDSGDGGLAKRLSELMDEDSMWEDIVEPELVAEFSSQREKVLKGILAARESREGEFIIERGDADDWYGALNQARLAMENRYQFGPREFRDPDELKDPETRSAFFRDEFYCSLQSLLLEYVMVDG